MKVGVIAGTGFYDLLEDAKELTVRTDYGDVIVYQGTYGDKEVYFLPRHGVKHDRLAHEINYRGNMMAMRNLEVDRILAFVAVGSLNLDIPVGHFALLDQFVDLTTNRVKTYGKYSVDISEPYCSDLRENFLTAAKELNINMTPKATYICVDGPRYETGGEIKLYRTWGMDVVGMTNGTEAGLAREMGLCYSAIALATDLAAGISNIPPDLDTHTRVVKENKKNAVQLILKALTHITEERSCGCQQAYERALAARKLK